MTEIDYSKVDWSGFAFDGFRAYFSRFDGSIGVRDSENRRIASNQKRRSEERGEWFIHVIHVDEARKAIRAIDAADEYAKAWHEKHNVTRVEVDRVVLNASGKGVLIDYHLSSLNRVGCLLVPESPGDLEIIVNRLEKA